MADRMNIALLGNITTEYVGKAIQDECKKYFIDAGIYNSPFSQYTQEILDKESAFYSSKPDLCIILLDAKVLLAGWHDFLTLQNGKRDQMVQETFNSIVSLIEKIHSNTGIKVIINNFTVPYHSPLGILDGRGTPGLKRMIAHLNQKLEDYAAGTDFLYVFDYNGLCSYEGTGRVQSKKMYYMSGNPFSFSFIKVLAREYMRYILPLKSRNKKCLVLDLDNTLWGGVAGEDGISGIKLDIAGTGRSFYDFQKEILNLYHRGILLAINSKNNKEDALDIIENHPHMLLREKYFSCLKINWQDKTENMKEIAKELNIGIDSLVFFDDNPVEREFVKAALPEVTVVDVPQDTSKYIDALHQIVEFDVLDITNEDVRRNEMYEQNRARREAEQKFKSSDEYLASLQSKVTVASANAFTIPRIAQLTQKTNQFNMTTRRYQVEDIQNMLASGEYLVYSCSVSDRFGDNGIVGCCIIKIENPEAFIDSFLLSCRVLGRNVEYAFLSAVIDELRKKGIENVGAKYVKTEKNRANEDFFSKAGFSKVSATENETGFKLGIRDKLLDFDYIHRCISEGSSSNG